MSLIEELQLVLGALDSLGVALADHHHTWTVGEREIYDQARAMLEGALRTASAIATHKQQPQ